MDAFLSFIALWPLEWAPRSWALCWGSLVNINSNPALYSLLGVNYGGDGRSTFALPDFRGRVPLGLGEGPGVMPYPRIGARGGTEIVSLNVSQLPEHSHNASLGAITVEFRASDQNATESEPGKNGAKCLGVTRSGLVEGSKIYNSETANVLMAGVSCGGGSVTVDSMGDGRVHENMQPYLVTNFIISLKGLYPSKQ